MTITKKYDLKMIFDQAGDLVSEDFMDINETQSIISFEEACLKLKEKNNNSYSMIELGSNQAYYSCLFRAIIDGVGNNIKCKNILLEPTPSHMERGIRHFEKNGFTGLYERAGIGHYWCWNDRWHESTIPSYTIDELMEKHGISDLDVLHSDIDGNEIRLLETSTSAFKDKKINYIFLLTHGIWNEREDIYKSNIIKNGEDRHAVSKKFLLDCGYELVKECDGGTVGYDGLLVFKRG